METQRTDEYIPEKEQTLEEIFMELDAIIQKMDQNDLALDETFSLYEQGIHKLKLCNEKIDHVEKKMLILGGQGDYE